MSALPTGCIGTHQRVAHTKPWVMKSYLKHTRTFWCLVTSKYTKGLCVKPCFSRSFTILSGNKKIIACINIINVEKKTEET